MCKYMNTYSIISFMCIEIYESLAVLVHFAGPMVSTDHPARLVHQDMDYLTRRSEVPEIGAVIAREQPRKDVAYQ